MPKFRRLMRSPGNNSLFNISPQHVLRFLERGGVPLLFLGEWHGGKKILCISPVPLKFLCQIFRLTPNFFHSVHHGVIHCMI
jgi:hypothetical protein